ncbi:MAG: acetyl-CoA carboxylase biotin carboxyl carrier protein [Phycisphaerales bacterium]
MKDIKSLKELVRLMVENDLTEIDLKEGEETITIKRGLAGHVVAHAPAPVMHHAAPTASPASSPAAAAPVSSQVEDKHAAIESPMVGTFYSSPDPESPPYVAVGKTVKADDVVCIIEAMKVFNEIKAERAGVVEKVLVQNGQPVEFGQKLFLIRPA